MAKLTHSRSIGPVLHIAAIVVALLPALALAGWIYVQHEGRERAGPASARAVADATALGDALDRWLVRRLDELRSWSEIPALVEGVRRAAVEHHERGYTEATPDTVNTLLVHDRNLGLAPQADEYLAVQVARSPAWSQLHYTDEYGFTVGVIGVEDDFVQTDETWWRRAWAQGRYEGPVGLDSTIGEYGIRLALRIDDPATEAAVGVMDGIVGVAGIHRLADAFARSTGAEFRILNAEGSLVAETLSGHARDRILKLSGSALGVEDWRAGVGSTGHSGGLRDARVERGWVRLTGAEGPHRDWIVIAERSAQGAAGSIGGMAAAGAGIGLAVVVGVVGGVWLRRRVATRLGVLAVATEQMCNGDMGSEIRIEGNDEIARIGRSVERLRETIRRAVEIVNRHRRQVPAAE